MFLHSRKDEIITDIKKLEIIDEIEQIRELKRDYLEDRDSFEENELYGYNFPDEYSLLLYDHIRSRILELQKEEDKLIEKLALVEEV